MSSKAPTSKELQRPKAPASRLRLHPKFAHCPNLTSTKCDFAKNDWFHQMLATFGDSPRPLEPKRPKVGMIRAGLRRQSLALPRREITLPENEARQGGHACRSPAASGSRPFDTEPCIRHARDLTGFTEGCRRFGIHRTDRHPARSDSAHSRRTGHHRTSADGNRKDCGLHTSHRGPTAERSTSAARIGSHPDARTLPAS